MSQLQPSALIRMRQPWSQPDPHLVGRQLRLLGNDSAVNVAQHVTLLLHKTHLQRQRGMQADSKLWRAPHKYEQCFEATKS